MNELYQEIKKVLLLTKSLGIIGIFAIAILFLWATNFPPLATAIVFMLFFNML
jgi:hypothetical protein